MTERAWGSWVDAIGPAEALIECCGQTHRVRWRRGTLVLSDHDLDAERAVVALGGEPSPCFAVLQAWSATFPRTDLRGVLFPLSGAMPESIPEPTPVRLDLAAPYVVRTLLPGARRAVWRVIEGQRHLSVLASLPPALSVRHALGQVVHHERRWDDVAPDVRMDLQDLLYRHGRAALTESMRSWRRIDPIAPVCAGCRLAGPGEKPEVEGRIERHRARGVVSLPLSWLATVVAPGAAVVDGCLVLSFRGSLTQGEALLVRWERVTSSASVPVTAPAVLSRSAGGPWSARWA